MDKKLDLQGVAMDYIVTKNNQWFGLLYANISNKLRMFIWKFFRNTYDPDIVDDVLSNTFYKAILKLDQYDPDKGNFITWIYTIAKNECLQEIKSKNKFIRFDTLLDCDGYISDESLAPDDYFVDYSSLNDIDYKVRKKAANIAIVLTIHRELPEVYKDVMILRVIKRMQYEDIAELLDVPLNTVKTRIFYSKKILEKILKPKLEKIFSI